MIRSREEALKVLGVGNNSTRDEWKSAYRAICKKYHPDNCEDETDEEKRSEAMNMYIMAGEAYSFLENSNDATRKPRIIGTPVAYRAKGSSSKYSKDKKEKELKQRKIKELKEKAENIRRKEEEDRILDEIRWIRVAEIIRNAINEDSTRTKKEKELEEAIRKADKSVKK